MIVLLAALSRPASAGDIFLAPGDDVLTKTAVLNAGDRYLFDDGVYEIAEELRWSGQGTEDEPIFIGAKEGAKPIFRMNGGYFLARIHDASWVRVEGIVFEGADGWADAGFNGIAIENATHVTVADNEIRFFDGYGIYISGASSEVAIERNWIHEVESDGIYVGCGDASCFVTDSTFANNQLGDLGVVLEDGTISDYASGVVLAHGSQGNTIRDNVVYRTSNDGIYVGSTEFGPQNIVEGNAVWETTEDGIVIEGSALVRNNVVFDVGDDGIRCYDSDRNTLEDVVISFNTVAGAFDYAVEVEDWVGKSGMVLANNAIVNPIGRGLRYVYDSYNGEEADGDNVITTNVVTGFVEGWDPAVHPVGVVPGGGYEDFAGAEGWDFYPATGSSLVNAADPSGDTFIPDVDFNGVQRQGDVPDVGAYEYGGAGNPGWAIEEGFKSTDVVNAAGKSLGGCCSSSETPEQAFILLPLLGVFGWRRRR